jgi:hypothetical protein
MLFTSSYNRFVALLTQGLVSTVRIQRGNITELMTHIFRIYQIGGYALYVMLQTVNVICFMNHMNRTIDGNVLQILLFLYFNR